MVKNQYLWPGMKREIAEYIARCMECQKVKIEHRHPTWLLQPLPILEWKWEVVTMDFITGLPRTGKLHDSIMVVVDRLTKAAHFTPLKTTQKAVDVANIFMKWYDCTKFLKRLCLTEIWNSPRISGKDCSKDSERIWTLVQLIIPSLMDRQKGWIEW